MLKTIRLAGLITHPTGTYMVNLFTETKVSSIKQINAHFISEHRKHSKFYLNSYMFSTRSSIL